MTEDEMIKYVITPINKRLNEMDRKLDQLISFRMMLLGGAGVIAGLVSIAMTLISAKLGMK